jgi:hypothetical protein
MSFLRILLIFALLYFAVRLLGRILFPSQRNSFSGGNVKPEGDVTVENNNQHGKNIKKDEGDYVDYEEVK